MDIKAISNLLLELFYIIIGGLFLSTAYRVAKESTHKTRIGTSIFWTILAVIFMFGAILPAEFVGILLLVIGGLTLTKRVNIGTLKNVSEEFSLKACNRLQSKVFIPSIVIAVVALLVAQFTDLGGTVAIGIAAAVALIVAFALFKGKPMDFVEDSDRLVRSVGPTAILPQLLAALGALFTAAGVGEVISGAISSVIPEGNILFGIIAYCLGMAIFTMIMGNSFAAFSVITVGIGMPFVFSHGGNPVVASALALTAGYCGTLLTPMAANFNVMPAALLETEDKNIVMKYQAPFATILLLLHIPLMYFLAF